MRFATAAIAAVLTFALATAILGLTPSSKAANATEPRRDAGAAQPKEPPYEMESHQLVLLVRAPTWKKLPDADASALQSAHIAHLTRMWEAGKAVVCGPFDQQQDPAFRGACIYAVKTPEEARTLASEDPLVKAGQLRVEAMTWWVGKGHMAFPKAQRPR